MSLYEQRLKTYVGQRLSAKRKNYGLSEWLLEEKVGHSEKKHMSLFVPLTPPKKHLKMLELIMETFQLFVTFLLKLKTLYSAFTNYLTTSDLQYHILR